MKKTFNLMMVALFLLAGVSNAQNYRKWDFTNWSATTVANLLTEAQKGVSGGAWSDIEKATATEPTELSKDKCFWEVTAQGSADGATLTANGQPIAELEGLLYVNTTARSLAIAVDYQGPVGDGFGPYEGKSYLWLGSSKKNYFVIPNVKPGQPIKIGLESHKITDARGVELYVYTGGAQGEKLDGPAVPKTYEEQEWTAPAEGTAGANEDGNYDILIYNTNGCHLYFIEVGTADQKSKVAYLYQGETDATLAVVQSIDNYDVEAIDITANKKTAAELQDYDAVVIAANVNDATYAAELKNTLGWTPIVNTSYGLYEAWGLGTAVKSGESVIFAKQKGNTLFTGASQEDPESGINYVEIEGEVYGIQGFGDYFAKDDTLGVDVTEALVTAHIHNASHNAYIFIPAGNAQLTANAIKVAANSKSKVSAAPKPVITLEYKDKNTNVTITSNVPGAQIFYTTDGSEPTEGSTPYTETFNVTAECTVKAVAKGDGYTLSEVTETAVDLKSQAVAPSISTEMADGQTIVTITGEGDIWYNYSNVTDTTKSAKYTEPIVMKMPRTLYAFTTAESMVPSEATMANISINNFQPRIDILAHMDANSAEYNGGSTSTAYYFSWGKNKSGESGYFYYNTEEGVETSVDPETGDETYTYTVMNPEESKDFENGWMVRARGQLTIWENQSTGTSYGNTGGYNYASVDDENPYFPATKGYINLADKNTQPSDATFPYNAYIVTTAKYAGPFDIVINAASITKEVGSSHQIVLQVSADGNVWESNWQTVGDTIIIKDSPRLTHNITRSYEGSDEVYVRAYLCGNNSKVGFYDIYLANAGEKSAELTGIAEQKAAPAAKQAAVYSLSGTRQNGLRRGLNIVVDGQGKAKKVIVK